MNWTEPLDVYCERIDPSFWAEPVNALSNAAFIAVGGIMLWRLFQVRQLKSYLGLLSTSVVIVGIGSFIFHTVANRWSMLADVLPIMVFMCLTFYYFFKNLFKFSYLYSVGGVLAFLAIGVLLQIYFPKLLNGSFTYVHALLALVLISVFSRKISPQFSRSLLLASGTFVLSLFFRTVDMTVCPHFPLGTHFLWHLCNGLLIWFILTGIWTFAHET